MAAQLLNSPPDFTQSVISRQKDLLKYRIHELPEDTIFMGREHVMLEQRIGRKSLELKAAEESFKNNQSFDDAETRETLKSIQRRYDEIDRMQDELISFRSPTKMTSRLSKFSDNH